MAHSSRVSAPPTAAISPSTAHMREAIRLATENVLQDRGGPFAAIVARDDRVIASGANEVTASNDPTAHAEIVAIRNACATLGTFQLEGCVVYCSCEPCPMCMGALYWARPEALFYAGSRADAAAVGFDDALIWAELALPPEARCLKMARFLPDEALAPFAAWRNSTTRIDY